MSKIKWGLLFLLCVFVLSSCSNKEDLVSLKEVTDQLEAMGVDLNAVTGEHQIEIQDKLPHEYRIGINEEDGGDWEFISIYIFHSVHDRQEGAKTMKEQVGINRDTEFPVQFEQKNVLVIYWSHSKGDPRFDTEISSALEKL